MEEEMVVVVVMVVVVMIVFQTKCSSTGCSYMHGRASRSSWRLKPMITCVFIILLRRVKFHSNFNIPVQFANLYPL